MKIKAFGAGVLLFTMLKPGKAIKLSGISAASYEVPIDALA